MSSKEIHLRLSATMKNIHLNFLLIQVLFVLKDLIELVTWPIHSHLGLFWIPLLILIIVSSLFFQLKRCNYIWNKSWWKVIWPVLKSKRLLEEELQLEVQLQEEQLLVEQLPEELLVKNDDNDYLFNFFQILLINIALY